MIAVKRVGASHGIPQTPEAGKYRDPFDKDAVDGDGTHRAHADHPFRDHNLPTCSQA